MYGELETTISQDLTSCSKLVSEGLVYFNQSTWRHISAVCNLHSCGNLKSYCVELYGVHVVPSLRMVDLYFHSPIRLHSVVSN
jgi:hypothetical protein